MKSNARIRRRWPAILGTILLVSAISTVDAHAEPAGSGGQPSASDRGPVNPTEQSPVKAPKSLFGAPGGTDVPLGGPNEPAVAVNPLDTNNIVAGSVQIRISTNNGANFSSSYRTCNSGNPLQLRGYVGRVRQSRAALLVIPRLRTWPPS